MTMFSAKRRMAALAAATLAAALALTACGSDSDGAAGNGSSESGAGYPVTIDTAYGEITLDKKPERIVALQGQYVDLLEALDEQPVAFTADVKDENALLADYPWLADANIAVLDPELTTAEYKASLEAIAEYDPDLILGNVWQIDENMYDQISQIAPTFVGVVKGNNDWDVLLQALGTLTGQTAKVDGVLEEINEASATAKERLPGLQGKSYNMFGFSNQRFFLGNGVWMELLGLKPAANQSNTESGGNTDTDISLENIDQLAADVVTIWPTPAEQKAILEADPRFDELPASINKTVIFADSPMAIAGNAAGPLSLKWLLEKAVPLLEDSDLNKALQ